MIPFEQLELLARRTRCGYCGHELDAMPNGTFACSTCAPHLADIRTIDEWEAFIARSQAA